MAKSNLQVMLTKNVTKLGKLGDLVAVKPGYAQNFLIPQGMAIRATTGVVKEVERRKEVERQRLIAIRQEAESRKVALSTIGGFIIKKKVGEGNAIFGSSMLKSQLPSRFKLFLNNFQRKEVAQCATSFFMTNLCQSIA